MVATLGRLDHVDALAHELGAEGGVDLDAADHVAHLLAAVGVLGHGPGGDRGARGVGGLGGGAGGVLGGGNGGSGLLDHRGGCGGQRAADGAQQQHGGHEPAGHGLHTAGEGDVPGDAAAANRGDGLHQGAEGELHPGQPDHPDEDAQEGVDGDRLGEGVHPQLGGDGGKADGGQQEHRQTDDDQHEEKGGQE